ncbi:saccharopine dehydrogenase family protein [Caulobacter sp.]|uniref:saccharopine dehydrogenase family protein n=1 Tax=Caulobacter sp. TaxID=78 RepID=UPI003BAE73A2
MNPAADFDVIVHGATGFTGRLVAEHFARHHPEVRWAMSGRNADKLAAVRDEIGARMGVSLADTPLIVADADSPASLARMVAQTKAVVTTVGPYQLYGSDLVAACAEAGTDYLDLCGEPAWMRQMIDAHERAAQDSGARIVFSCGFDSIPFELGVWCVQQEAVKRFGGPVARVKGRVRAMRGTFSGGTAASLKATLAAAARDPQILDYLKDPFALTPDFAGPKQPHGAAVAFDEDLGSWTAPFVMAAINTRNVHRSNWLMDQPYGADFVYDEMILTGPGEAGEAAAKAVGAANASMGAEGGPKPGEGPSLAEREAGFYDVLFVGLTDDGRQVRASVKGDKDPGYGSTSKMIAETALCLIDTPEVAGGVWTPGAALRGKLVERLQAKAGLAFAVE